MQKVLYFSASLIFYFVSGKYIVIFKISRVISTAVGQNMNYIVLDRFWLAVQFTGLNKAAVNLTFC